MAPPREFVAGLSHHVFHRGNNRGQIFHDDVDRKVFLVLLGKAARKGSVAIHSYSLMGNHYHATLTSPEEGALPRMMQRLGRGYVRYFNERHARTGTLWEGRYRASLITDERYWLTCMRYVEMNPVEANIVKEPGAYKWSSYRHHASGQYDALLTPHPLYLTLGNTDTSRRAQWRALCGQAIDPEDRGLIEAALRSNRSIHRPGFEEFDEATNDLPPFVPAP